MVCGMETKLPKLIGSEKQIKWASEKLEILAASLDSFLAWRLASGTPSNVCESIRAIFESATLNASDVINEYKSLSVVMRCDTKAAQMYTDGAMRSLINFIKTNSIK